MMARAYGNAQAVEQCAQVKMMDIAHAEADDCIALGLMAVNTAIFVGYRLGGTKGSIVATLGSILPPFFIILAIAMIFTGYKDNPVVEAIFKGIRPAVVALIAVPTIKMALRQKWNWVYGILAIATMALIAFLKVSPIYIILVVGVIAAFVAKYREGRQ